jgi:hypothetical protein
MLALSFVKATFASLDFDRDDFRSQWVSIAWLRTPDTTEFHARHAADTRTQPFPMFAIAECVHDHVRSEHECLEISDESPKA